jgi:hypothetical protein
MGSSSEGSSTNGGQSAQHHNANGDADAINTNGGGSGAPIPDNSSVPKPKRLACMICRKRKLKCDGVRPSCSTCSRLGHMCAYDEQRRKSGPKRGYVKALEERLSECALRLWGRVNTGRMLIQLNSRTSRDSAQDTRSITGK